MDFFPDFQTLTDIIEVIFFFNFCSWLLTKYLKFVKINEDMKSDFKKYWAPLCDVCIIEWCAFRTYCHFIRKWNVYSSTILINTFRARSIKRIFYSLHKYASSRCENRLTHTRSTLIIHQSVSHSKVAHNIIAFFD